MDRTDDKKWDLETGARVQERAQFYSLTLSFTLLALSVQTAVISGNGVAILETIASISLLVSGLSGLWRALSVPKLYKISVHLHSLHENLDDAKEIQGRGFPLIYSPLLEKNFKVDDYTDEHEKGIKAVVSNKTKLEKTLSRWMRLHKYGLLIGLVALMASRVFLPAFNVLFGQ